MQTNFNVIVKALSDRERILCVDDDPQALRSLERLLDGKYTVVVAPGREEALAAIASEGPFAVIICDLRLPGAQGLEFLNHLRDVTPHSERLILTGWADPVTVSVAAMAGRAMRLLLKPCPPDDLRQAVSDAVMRNRARQLRLSPPHATSLLSCRTLAHAV